MSRLSRSTIPTTAYEDGIVNGHLGIRPAHDVEDEDEQYDVYLFWPSTSQYCLLPEHLAHDDLYEATSPTLYSSHSQPDDELCAASTTPPMSPTYSFVDDYVFPEPDSTGGMGLAGYSRLFTAGLALKSRQITRQLDNAYLSLRRVFNWFRR